MTEFQSDAHYPFQTLSAPTLAEVITGLQIAASNALPRVCFRDINSGNKFGMEEVIWMMRKAAGMK